MDHKTKYEITITRKLEEIPIPDLSELIWSRIEAELDTDPGDIDNDIDPVPTSPAGSIIIGGLGIIIIIALLVNFFSDKKTNSALPENTRRENEIIRSKGSNIPLENETPAVETKTPQPLGPGNPTIVQDSNTDAPLVIDSASKTQDSATISLPLPPAPVIADTTPVKKTRGVKGISPDDYKIVPKKDSLNP